MKNQQQEWERLELLAKVTHERYAPTTWFTTHPNNTNGPTAQTQKTQTP